MAGDLTAAERFREREPGLTEFFTKTAFLICFETVLHFPKDSMLSLELSLSCLELLSVRALLWLL